MILETEKIRLELTNLNNIYRIIQIESDNSEFVGQYDTNKHKDVINDDDGLHLSIIEKSNSSLIGYIILAGLTNTNDSIEFRRIVVSEKGKGFGKDSLTLVKKHCFENLNAHRIWLDVFEDNFRAIQLYKSQGFSIDGILRDSVKRNGKYFSLLLMSILKSDFGEIAVKINYNGKRFIPVKNSDNGEISSDTIFIYKQQGNIVTSEYSGNKIKKGHLIGIVDTYGEIDMRYHQVNSDGKLMTGICRSKPDIMENGKIRLHEKWKWTSGDETGGESILEEI